MKLKVSVFVFFAGVYSYCADDELLLSIDFNKLLLPRIFTSKWTTRDSILKEADALVWRLVVEHWQVVVWGEGSGVVVGGDLAVTVTAKLRCCLANRNLHNLILIRD